MILRKSNTAGGTRFLRRAITLAKAIIPRFGQKTEVVDGYLVRGKRVGDMRVAEVLDPPAWLVVVGQIKAAAMSWVPVQLSLILEYPEGRDGFIGVGKVPEFESQAGVFKYVFSSMHKDNVLGTVKSGPTLMCVSGRPSQYVPHLGVAHGYALCTHPPTVGNVNPFAFIPRTEQVRYITVVSPPQYARLYAQLVDNVWETSRVPDPELPLEETPIPITLTVVLTDSVLRAYGALPFCMRQSPPPYDAGASGAHTFSEAQAPWHDFVVDYYTNEAGEQVCRVVMWASAVTEMLSDSDRFGAKALWVGTVEVKGRAAAISNQFMVDTAADPDPRRRPWAVSASEYAYNAHMRAGGALLRTGTVIILDPFQISRPPADGEPVTRYSSVDLHWIDRTGAKVRTVSVLSGFPARQAHDMRCPTGVATDGTEAIAPMFSTPFRGVPCGFDVIRADEHGAEVILSTTVPFYPCVGGLVGTHFTAGRLDGDHWEAMGGGDRRVCYIGNGKYLFYVSSVLGTGLFASGDWGVAVFDRANLTVQFAGTIDPTIYPTFDTVTPGQPVCLVPEVELEDGSVRKATVLATRGGTMQHEDYPGIEQGSTWISYDSGETWALVVNVGSPGGVYYCGNILAAAGTAV